ncbi:MAG: MBL fold metallo-hydrolase [Acidimicrobiia bacterium]|jgi:glyoxylase-like metal-dependent hydrolase (beta-lactamase superfamily II)
MFDELGDGVFRRRYESLDLNVGVVIGDDGVLLVDTRASHRQARELAEELRSITDLPVRWVVNTHWHWDHTFGNAVFRDAEIWGHELCAVALSTRGEEMKAGAREWLPEDAHPEVDEVEIVPPAKTFSDRASLQIGREVRLSYHGFGHTDADIVVRVPTADVAFFGDLIEEGSPPAFGDSHPVAWPLSLRLASSELPTVIVPGHGDVVDADFVEMQLQELAEVAELASSYVKGDVGLDEGVISGPYSKEVMRGALLRAQAVA